MATMKDAGRLSPTGVRSCWNIVRLELPGVRLMAPLGQTNDRFGTR
jgi:hypothetical protein